MNASDAGRTSSYYRYRFGTVEFDEAKKELRVGGLPIEIERRPLQVLEYLLQHIGETVTKEELLREVWENRTPTEQTLTNAIVKLRRALGEANEQYIVNQARIGYRIAGPVERAAVGRRLASQISLAADEPVPQRPNFRLKRILGSTKGSEVWLAEHAKTSDLRVYKFATHSDRLSSLKREATLSRLLHESLGPRPDIAQVIDWNFTDPPFFLECAYGGHNLVEWNKGDAPLARCTVEQRIQLFLQVARAVAAAHGIGVLHKDIKPANVLVKGHENAWQLQLTDFGSSRLLEPDRLAEYGITQLGLTITQQNLGGDSTTGTPLYIAPELLKGQTPTVLSDVYSLGVMLYQFLIADFGSPMASGWERGIEDELLRDDIRQATDGEPIQRIASVAELIARLEQLEARRAKLQSEAAQKELAVETAAALARSRARRPFVVSTFIVLALGAAISTVLAVNASAARSLAQAQYQRAAAINEFLSADLLSQANPVKSGQADTSFLAAVENAALAINFRFSTQPDVAASLHLTVAQAYDVRGAVDLASKEYMQAAELYRSVGGKSSENAVIAELSRAELLARLPQAGAFEEAKKIVAEQSAIIEGSANSENQRARPLVLRAQGVVALRTGDAASAVKFLRSALDIADAAKLDKDSLFKTQQLYATALNQSGDKRQAEAVYRQLISERNAMPGEHQTAILILNSALLLVLTQDGRYEEAVAEANRIEDEIRTTFGENSERFAMLVGIRGMAEGSLGRFEEARRDQLWMYEHAVSVAGKDGMFAKAALTDLASTECESGDWESGMAHAGEAYASLKEYGANRGFTSGVSLALASCLTAKGDLNRAEEVLVDVDPQALDQAVGLRDSWVDKELVYADIKMRRGNTEDLQGHLDHVAGTINQPHIPPYSRAKYQKLRQHLASMQLKKF